MMAEERWGVGGVLKLLDFDCIRDKLSQENYFQGSGEKFNPRG
jgi:hypothetical protein